VNVNFYKTKSMRMTRFRKDKLSSQSFVRSLPEQI
jgi:hypothetical protein